MAGDWIKLEHATLDKPEIRIAAEMLNMSMGDAFLLFARYWVWLDQNLDETRNGFVTLVSRRSVDQLMRCDGFASILEAIKWAKFDDEKRTLYVVNWQYHTGKTAKSRANAQKRQSRFRNAPRNAFVTLTPSPEKRREEVRPPSYSTNTQSVKINGAQRATRLLPDWSLPEEWKDWACKVHHLEPQRVVRISLAFRDFWIAKPGPGGTKLDWLATWRNWIRKEVQDA